MLFDPLIFTSKIFRQPSKSFMLRPFELAPTNLPSSKTSIAVNFDDAGAFGMKEETVISELIDLIPKSVAMIMLSSDPIFISFKFFENTIGVKSDLWV